MNLTEEQFLEQYGDVKVKLRSYYKFTFTFTGKTKDRITITVAVGGNSDDIYRESIIADQKYRVRELGFSYAKAEADVMGTVAQCFNSY
jgi:hypothetical protein